MAKKFLLAESKALVEIFLKMKLKLNFDRPIFFYTLLFFGGLQVRPTVPTRLPLLGGKDLVNKVYKAINNY
jgi:hypothetical protein